MAEAVFWTSFAFVFYVYLGYPLLVLVWRWVARKPVRKGYWEPSVTIVMAVHNERETIETKLLNCLELNYPRDRMQIIVSLDGPTDGTEEIARQYENRGIEVLYCPRHGGKAAALNQAVSVARGEVIVFVDARQRLELNAVRELVANFRDSSVGAASGELILLDPKAPTNKQAADAVGLYWRYEKWLRALESEIHSAVGASGALYAIRRELIQPLLEDTILDDVAIPMQTVLAGRRIVFEPAAKAYDRVACCPHAEFGRKVRTLMGNYQLLTQMPTLLLPWRNPVFLQFISHKVGRLLVPYFLVGLFVSNLFLRQGFYLVMFVLQSTWYLLACTGALVFRSRESAHRVRPFLFSRGYKEGS
ncbi:MAG: glycosyltransferase family 2 protein [Acidobacteria bacterium]|nr:glycosyltransferase family 2 protein [Acidobacteriota bacterium]